jgi:pimeloyl-ACP methyl ester carboxylesterase
MRKEVQADGIIISYLEQNEASEHLLIFVHGTSTSAHFWQKQFDSPELSSYHLVAFDLPGHGQSHTLGWEQYNFPYMSKLLAAATQKLFDKRPYVLIGFSSGANVVAEMLPYNVSPCGIVLLGPTVLGERYTLQDIFKGEADMTALFVEQAPDETIYQFINDASCSPNSEDKHAFVTSYKSAHPPFRPAVLEAYNKGIFCDDIKLLQQTAIPLLICFGAEDRLVKPDYLDEAPLSLWNNQIYKLDRANHFVSIDQPVIVNALLQQYARDVFRDSHVSTHNSTAP